MSIYFIDIIILLVCVWKSVSSTVNEFPLPVMMPFVSPTQPETYFCAAFALDRTQTKFVVGFQPKASMKIVHHMLLYGCTVPGQTEGYWNCGVMGHHHKHHDTASAGDGKNFAGVCAPGQTQKILYAWARDAPALDLPEGVAFEIGGNTAIHYLVLQVHYSDISSFIDGKKDDSGVFLRITETPQPKTAGILILSTGGQLKAQSSEYLEVSCPYEDENEIHPFRFRTHTHSLGKLVSGYKVTRDSSGVDHWTKIGSRNPMDPQMFYPADNEVTVRKGDVLAARCTMFNDRNTLTVVGSTNKHEMCNFYIMYWTQSDRKPSREGSCNSPGPPKYYWNIGPQKLNNIPSEEVTEATIRSM